MPINKITLENFMRFDDAVVELPSKGKVLITGLNGEGKSAIIDAIAVARYNKTLRGTPWWRPGTAGKVTLQDDKTEIIRTRSKKGTAGLSWKGGANFDTNSKAQEELDQTMEPFDVWRRCSVFSSRGTSSFSSATDAERKRLLESLLGLDRFDPALKNCRVELSRAKREYAQLDADLRVADNSKKYEEQRLVDAQRRVQTISLPDRPPEERLATLQESVRTDTQRIHTLKKSERALANVGQEHLARASSLSRQLRNLRAELCPTCGQSIPEELRKDLAAQINDANEDAKKERAKRDVDLEKIQSEIDALEKAVRGLSSEVATLEADARHYKAARKESKILKSTLTEAKKSLLDLEEQSMDLEDDRDEQDNEIKVLALCEKVLGMKGVRSHILADMLTSLEIVTNKWLEIMDVPQRIKLKPYSEKKTGGVKDAIGLDIENAGGGYGYDAASSGQQRRIDVGLVLGLADLSQASYGLSGVTTFFDEVFDTLDRPGTEGVIEALDEMSEDRTVVVISHSQLVKELFQPDLHLHVQDGKIIKNPVIE